MHVTPSNLVRDAISVYPAPLLQCTQLVDKKTLDGRLLKF